MSELPAFRKLQAFIAEQTARKPSKKGLKSETGNSLNRHINTRPQLTRTYRDDLNKYVPSQQLARLPDILVSPKLLDSLYNQRHPIPRLATPDLPKSTFIP